MESVQVQEPCEKAPERDLGHIQIEYSHAAAQLGDRMCKLMMIEEEIKVLKKTMLDLNVEAKAMSKPELAHA